VDLSPPKLGSFLLTGRFFKQASVSCGGAYCARLFAASRAGGI